MPTSPPDSILRKIAKVEEKIVHLKDQQDEAETTLRLLRKQLDHNGAETRDKQEPADESLTLTHTNLGRKKK